MNELTSEFLLYVELWMSFFCDAQWDDSWGMLTL